jgi:hypothetical protein
MKHAAEGRARRRRREAAAGETAARLTSTQVAALPSPLHDSTFSRPVWRLCGGAKGLDVSTQVAAFKSAFDQFDANGAAPARREPPRRRSALWGDRPPAQRPACAALGGGAAASRGCRRCADHPARSGDGTIDTAELGQVLGRAGLQKTAAELGALVAALDRDGGGSIDLAESVGGTPPFRRRYMIQPLAELHGGCMTVLKVSWCGILTAEPGAGSSAGSRPSSAVDGRRRP